MQPQDPNSNSSSFPFEADPQASSASNAAANGSQQPEQGQTRRVKRQRKSQQAPPAGTLPHLVPNVANIQMMPVAYHAAPSQDDTSDDFDLRQFLIMIRRRAAWVGGVAVTVTALTWASTLTKSPVYQGSFDLYLSLGESARVSYRSDLIGLARELQTELGIVTQIEILKSPLLLNPLYQSLQASYPDLTFEELSDNLSLTNPRSSQILTISYQGTDPEQIEAVLQAVSETYLAYSLQQKKDSLIQGIAFVDQELPKVEERVQSKRQELEAFRQTYALVDPEAKGSQLASILQTLQQQQRETQVAFVEARSKATVLQQQLGSSADIAITSAILSEAPHYQEALNELKEIQRQIALESARFTSNSPQIQALVDRRQNLEYLLQVEAQKVLGTNPGGQLNDHMTSIPLEFARQLADLSVTVQVLQVRVQALQTVEQQISQEFSQIPQLATQYGDIKRELDMATESFTRLLATRENLQIEAAQTAVPWKLLSTPTVLETPIAPNVPRNLLTGLLAGLGLGVGAGMLIDRLDNVVHDVDELKTLSGLPLLGRIPYNNDLENFDTRTGSSLTGATSSLNLGSDPAQAQSQMGEYRTSPFLEAFRLLYGNLRFRQSDSALMSFAVSSALLGDGKSTISLYLAQAAAAMGQRVLVVDADMRCPKLHRRLGLPNLQGLSNVLARKIDPDQVIQVIGPNLAVLTAGQMPPDPSSLLSSNRMQFLMERFEAAYDLVIYDTPPMMGLADASILASYMDGILLTVGLGKTDRSVLRTVLENIKVANLHVLGLVANGLNHGSQYTDKYYSYYKDAARYYHAPQDDVDGTLVPAPIASPGETQEQTVEEKPFEVPHSSQG
ncbi:MAG: polysaccharide biosynthesis tyrosine autokinase [Prochlorothrix sp.]|nr:polysaccharide biosynthesis tyrosine autokinase [Prochlorothrix sp.]